MGGTVSIIDIATNMELGTIVVGNSPFSIALTPDGTRAYVTNSFSASVSVIDTATNTVVADIGMPTPAGVAISPDGGRAYVTSQVVLGTVTIIDTATNTVIGSPIAVGFTPGRPAITPDGTSVYVPNFSSDNERQC